MTKTNTKTITNQLKELVNKQDLNLGDIMIAKDEFIKTIPNGKALFEELAITPRFLKKEVEDRMIKALRKFYNSEINVNNNTKKIVSVEAECNKTYAYFLVLKHNKYLPTEGEYFKNTAKAFYRQLGYLYAEKKLDKLSDYGLTVSYNKETNSYDIREGDNEFNI